MAWPAAPLAFTRVELQTRSPAAPATAESFIRSACFQ